MFAVQLTSVVPSQNPIVSPYHCGTLCTCAVLPTITWRRKLSAMPERNWIFRREERQHRRHLRDAPDPLRAAIGLRVTPVVAIPIGHGGLRVDRGTALRFRLGEQRFVVFLRRLVRIRAQDALLR